MSEYDKIYCGAGKSFGKFNQIGLSICLDDIPSAYIEASQSNGKKYVKLKVCERKEPDKYGNKFYVIVDTWKPNGGQASNNNISAGNGNNSGGNNMSFEDLREPENPDDVPF
jgi:hypothetical protein